MFLDLEATQGERFQFFTSTVDPSTGDIAYDDPKGDAYVTLRSMQPFFEAKLAKRPKKVEHVFNPKSRSMERISYYPDLSTEEARVEREEAWDYTIVDFEGFKDSKTGDNIACTKDNKIKLMKIPVFDRFVARCFQIMAESGIKEKEESEKNS
jgi:hypothetical protein